MIRASKRKPDLEKTIKILKANRDQWPSTLVARREIPKFTGGVFAVGTLANEDSSGTGPEGAFRIGRQVVYSTENLTAWLISRLEG